MSLSNSASHSQVSVTLLHVRWAFGLQVRDGCLILRGGWIRKDGLTRMPDRVYHSQRVKGDASARTLR